MSTGEYTSSILGPSFCFAVSRIVRVIYTIVLARFYLTPDEFGLIAILLVTGGFFEALANAGLREAVIRKKEVSDSDVSTFFWVSMFASIIVAIGVFILFSLFVFERIGNPQLLPLSLMYIPVLILNIQGILPKALLARNNAFLYIAVSELVATMLGALSALLFAYLGAGVTSLAVFYIVFTTTNIFMLFRSSPVRIKKLNKFKRQSLINIAGFSVLRMITVILNYTSNKVDRAMIVSSVGTYTLGIYHQAYTYALMPFQLVVQIVNQIFYPMVSRLESKSKVANSYYGMFHLIICLAILLAGFYLIFSEILVLVLLGDKWSELVPYINVFSIYAIFFVTQSVQKVFLLAEGKAGTILRINFLYNSITTIGVVYLIDYGAINVAMFILMMMMMSCMTYIVGLFRILEIGLGRIFGLFFNPLAFFVVSMWVSNIPGFSVFGVSEYLFKYLIFAILFLTFIVLFDRKNLFLSLEIVLAKR